MALSPEKITNLVVEAMKDKLKAEAILLHLKPGMITSTNLLTSLKQVFTCFEYKSIQDGVTYEFYKSLAVAMSLKQKSFDVLYAWSHSFDWCTSIFSSEFLLLHYSEKITFEYCFEYLRRLSKFLDSQQDTNISSILSHIAIQSPISRVKRQLMEMCVHADVTDTYFQDLVDCLNTSTCPILLECSLVLLEKHAVNLIKLEHIVRCVKYGNHETQRLAKNYLRQVADTPSLYYRFTPQDVLSVISEDDVRLFAPMFHEFYSCFHRVTLQEILRKQFNNLSDYFLFQKDLGDEICMFIFRLYLYFYQSVIPGNMIVACFTKNTSAQDRAEMMKIILEDEVLRITYASPAKLLYSVFHHNADVYGLTKEFLNSGAVSLQSAWPMEEFLNLVLKSDRDEVAFKNNYDSSFIQKLNLEELFILILEKNSQYFTSSEIWALFDKDTADHKMKKAVDALIVMDISRQNDIPAYIKQYVGYIRRERCAKLLKEHFPEHVKTLYSEEIQKMLK